MTAFIISAAIAFAVYELLASIDWPNEPENRGIPFRWGRLIFHGDALVTARNLLRAAIVTVILLSVLVIHNFAPQFDLIANYEVNIVFGFLFGPLFAIWVNSVALHSAYFDLSRGQILAAISLVVLFLLGAIGNEASRFIRQYSRNLSSVKLGGAELSFTKERSDRDRLTTPSFAQQPANAYSVSPSQGLSNLVFLDKIIRRDNDYLTKAFTHSAPIDDLKSAEDFAKASIVPPLTCLSSWFRQNADASLVEKYLTAYADAFRQLEALNTHLNMPRQRGQANANVSERLQEISADFVRNGLTMALDIALSTTNEAVLESCKEWFDVYCPAGPQPDIKCLRNSLSQFAPNGIRENPRVDERIFTLADRLASFMAPSQSTSPLQRSADTRGLEALPYFAIARASLMAQLEQNEAAAAILDGWLQRNDEVSKGLRELQEKDHVHADDLHQITAEWFVLRVRSVLVVYVDQWIEDEGAAAATVVQTEHLKNLRLAKDGFRIRLLKADFFREIDKACQTECKVVFRRPAECGSKEQRETLDLWKKLYLSYITFEYTYIHRALQHPDYPTKYAETINDEARRLVSYDASCSSPDQDRDVVYAQSVLAFVENAVSYARVRARIDSEDTQKMRLDEAERAAKFGLELVKDAATDDRERTGKPYLDRIAPSFAVQVQDNLNEQLKRIDQARRDFLEQ